MFILNNYINSKLPVLTNQKALMNRERYFEWVITYKFSNVDSAITSYDMHPLIHQLLKQFKLPIIDYYVYFIEELLIEIYLDTQISNYQKYYIIKPEFVHIGTYALAFLRRDSDWINIDCISEYTYTFIRCLLYELKHKPLIKEYFEQQAYIQHLHSNEFELILNDTV